MLVVVAAAVAAAVVVTLAVVVVNISSSSSNISSSNSNIRSSSAVKSSRGQRVPWRRYVSTRPGDRTLPMSLRTLTQTQIPPDSATHTYTPTEIPRESKKLHYCQYV